MLEVVVQIQNSFEFPTVGNLEIPVEALLCHAPETPPAFDIT
jgi:hypothetical protein